MVLICAVVWKRRTQNLDGARLLNICTGHRENGLVRVQEVIACKARLIEVNGSQRHSQIQLRYRILICTLLGSFSREPLYCRQPQWSKTDKNRRQDNCLPPPLSFALAANVCNTGRGCNTGMRCSMAVQGRWGVGCQFLLLLLHSTRHLERADATGSA